MKPSLYTSWNILCVTFRVSWSPKIKIHAQLRPTISFSLNIWVSYYLRPRKSLIRKAALPGNKFFFFPGDIIKEGNAAESCVCQRLYAEFVNKYNAFMERRKHLSFSTVNLLCMYYTQHPQHNTANNKTQNKTKPYMGIGCCSQKPKCISKQ